MGWQFYIWKTQRRLEEKWAKNPKRGQRPCSLELRKLPGFHRTTSPAHLDPSWKAHQSTAIKGLVLAGPKRECRSFLWAPKACSSILLKGHQLIKFLESYLSYVYMSFFFNVIALYFIVLCLPEVLTQCWKCCVLYKHLMNYIIINDIIWTSYL